MFFKRLCSLRQERGLTQDQIAEFLSISPAVYSSYESGARAIPTEYLLALADYYNVSADYIVCRTDERKLKR